MDEQGFNSCPTKQEIEKILKDLDLKLKFVDLEKDYWKNDYDTMVFEKPKETFEQGLLLADRLDPDEVHFCFIVIPNIPSGGKKIVRLWWD